MFLAGACFAYASEQSLVQRRSDWAAIEDTLLTLHPNASDAMIKEATKAPMVHISGAPNFEHGDSTISQDVFSIRRTEQRCQWHEEKWELSNWNKSWPDSPNNGEGIEGIGAAIFVLLIMMIVSILWCCCAAVHDARVRSMAPSDATFREAAGNQPAAYVVYRPQWDASHVDSSSFLRGHSNSRWNRQVKTALPQSIRIGHFAVNEKLASEFVAQEARRGELYQPWDSRGYQPMQTSDRTPPKSHRACFDGSYTTTSVDCTCTAASIGASKFFFETLKLELNTLSIVGALSLGRGATAEVVPPAKGTLGARLGAHLVRGSASALEVLETGTDVKSGWTFACRLALCMATVLAVVQMAHPRGEIDAKHATALPACLLGLAIYSALISLLWCCLHGVTDVHGQQTSHTQLALLAGSLTMCAALRLEWTTLTRESGPLPGLIRKLRHISGNYFRLITTGARRGAQPQGAGMVLLSMICGAFAIALGGVLGGGSGLGGWRRTKEWALLLLDVSALPCLMCFFIALWRLWRRRKGLAAVETGASRRPPPPLRVDCPVCLEEQETANMLVLQPCGHAVCRQCFPRLNLNDGCPNCRARVTSQLAFDEDDAGEMTPRGTRLQRVQ